MKVLAMAVAAFVTTALPADAQYVRPYGPSAPWNIPVAQVPAHPQSDLYRDRLWFGAPDRVGNYNLSFDSYTYPVYDAAQATGQFPVTVRYNWGSNLVGQTIPWNPNWRPSTGSDGQVIILDAATGREWNLWQVSFRKGRVTISNGNLVPGSYWEREVGFPPSRGCGIMYLAMLVRPEELAAGVIEHALSMPIRNPDGSTFVPPATKLERQTSTVGVPEGMRFALNITDAEIEDWVASMPAGLSAATRQAARVIARALRDYGWFVTDTAGAAHLQFEDRRTAGAEWTALGLGAQSLGGKEYPRDLLDGLFTQERIYALEPPPA